MIYLSEFVKTAADVQTTVEFCNHGINMINTF